MQPIIAFLTLVITTTVCCGGGGGGGSGGGGGGSNGGGVTTQAEPSIGNVSRIRTSVQAEHSGNITEVESSRDFFNNDSITVRNNGKGKVTFIDGTELTLYNDTITKQVIAEVSPPEVSLQLTEQGFQGNVPKGNMLTVNFPNGASVRILGTHFFVLFDSGSNIAIVGNFDGTVQFTLPSGAQQDLPPSKMVDINPDSTVNFLELPYDPGTFDIVADDAGSPVEGLKRLRMEFDQPLPGETPPTEPPITFTPGPVQATGDEMQPGEVLFPSQSISSANGRYEFIYQGDGNLVLYDGTKPLWASGTDGKPAGVCIMQDDGNLVIYTLDDQSIWASNTDGNPGSRLIVQDDGNVVIYRPDNSVVWATNTPLTSTVFRHLVTRTGDSYVPDLADSWSVDPDGYIILFNLRPGIYLLDGTPFTSTVVRSQLESKWQYAIDGEVGFEIIDDYTIKFQLFEPAVGYVLDQMSMFEFEVQIAPPPDVMVINYWRNISDRRYSAAWNQLSTDFQERMHDGSFSNFENGYIKMQVCTIETSNVRVLSEDREYAIVSAHMTYRTGDSCTASEYDFEIHLVFDQKRYVWLYDRTIIK